MLELPRSASVTARCGALPRRTLTRISASLAAGTAVRPVALGGPEGEAVSPYEVGDLCFPNHGVRQETDEIRLSQRLRSLRGDEHRAAERDETREPTPHGRGHCDRSNRRSAASTSA